MSDISWQTQYDEESVGSCVLYLRADANFVPLKSTNDISPREAWDSAKFERLEAWLDAHMPKLTDLGVVEVSASHPTRLDLGAGTVCVLSTRDIHNSTVPYWLSIDLTRETADLAESRKSWQHRGTSRTNEPISFAMDGKFYQLTPKLVK